eukprot:TRINITY_DN14870_c0_g3_i1.p1 TRINITY_DN14870_c0_g3~~TRINITY_DN14870_c0_g3_i1.p1  ORF type:complete len:179 (+),score=23.85 TRINITY_DN14870_c0_g3_i1:71-538(+)
MVACDSGLIASCVSFIASACTLSLGLAYIVLRIESLDFHFQKCGFFEEDCNDHWRGIFTLRPNVLLDVWTPVLIGILGLSVHVTRLRFCQCFAWVLPADYVQYAVFMFVTALFANVGYCGQCGIIVGAVSAFACTLCIIARLVGDGQIKMLQTKW